jgi:LacI family transcriptional regulator
VSTVSLPGYRMGELAIELLLEEIHQDSGHVHRTVMLDPHLIPRRSTVRSHEGSVQ